MQSATKILENKQIKIILQ